MKRYTVVTDPNTTELFRVHDAACPDITRREARLFREGNVSSIFEHEAESAAALLDSEMRSDFSDSSEHPATAKYPGGSYGAAGFTGRILPCCKNAVVIA